MLEQYYTPEELAEAWHISEQTVRDKANKHIWPSSTFAGKTRFSEADVEAIRNMGKRQPRTPARSNRARNKHTNDLLESK